jgi:predicted RNase H-like HicB family nuclease
MANDLVKVLHQPALNIQLFDAGDGYVGAECLDIPGCFSQGKTKDEALANIVDAIGVCLDVIAEKAITQFRESRTPPDADAYKLVLATSTLEPVCS